MKNLLIFLFGAACGAGGAIIWLRKGIKKELEAIKNGEDLPFEMKKEGENDGNEGKNESSGSENNGKNSFKKAPVAVTEETRVAYNTIIEQVKNGDKTDPRGPVLVAPRDENDVIDESISDDFDDVENENTRGEAFLELDRDEFDNNPEYQKERIVYFAGDRVMCTEAGTIIPNPYLLVGNQWEQWVGKYANNTAFVRNMRLSTDYEIYVENGTYVEEYGLDSM